VAVVWPLGFVLGIIPQLGRNRFESPSLLDSENLTKQNVDTLNEPNG
jgi:hypothetical protein